MFSFHEGTEIYRLEEKVIYTSVFHFRPWFVQRISDFLNVPTQLSESRHHDLK